MAERSEWRLLALLLLAAAILALLLSPGGGRSGLDPRASTFRATPNGTLGLYLFLEELGILTERRLTPLVDAEPLPRTLVLLEPTESLSPREVDAVLGWVEEGGRLIYAAAPDDRLLQGLGLALDPVFGDSVAGTGAATATPATDHPLTRGVERAYAFRFAFADSSPAFAGDVVPLLRVGEGRLGLVLLHHGRGQVLAWSDAAPLANHSLRSGDAALLMARAVREFAPEGEAIHFDEFHHGFVGGGSPVGALTTFLRETSAGRMTLQLAVVAAGLLVLLGSRFGAPVPPLPPRRRSPLEHLHALAAAYRAGNARGRARHLLVAGTARRLGKRPPAAGGELAFLSALASTAYGRREAAEALLDEWRRGDAADLITLASRADRLVTETNAS